MRKSGILHIATAITLLASALSADVHAAGSGGATAPSYDTATRALSPQQRSDKAFRAGVKQRDKALKQEAKAAKARSEKAREKALSRAQKAYAKAIDKQGEALQHDPQNYKAANELGFALRKTGDYRKAIGAYNYALEINPNYHPATEYRGEAFLALGLFEQTKQAYMVLFREDKTLAAQLMARFDEWIAEQGQSLDETQTAFVAWVGDRKRMAQITSDLSLNNTRTW